MDHRREEKKKRVELKAPKELLLLADSGPMIAPTAFLAQKGNFDVRSIIQLSFIWIALRLAYRGYHAERIGKDGESRQPRICSGKAKLLLRCCVNHITTRSIHQQVR